MTAEALAERILNASGAAQSDYESRVYRAILGEDQ